MGASQERLVQAAALRAQLTAGSGQHLARCWRIDRSDGVALGFTDHDCDLSFDGVVFEARSGLSAGAIEQSTGLSVDNTQAQGALRSDRIGEKDILAGRFDDASVQQWLVDWTDTDARILLFAGTLGEISAAAGGFEAELRGLSERLNHPVGRTYPSACDRALGDAKCGVDLEDPRYFAKAEVTGLSGKAGFVWAPVASFDPAWFVGGQVVWISGANAGLSARVRTDQGDGSARIAGLWTSPQAPIAVGDEFRIETGCDKRLATCRARFDNAVNFRGFPHIPGDDWVMAYPRSGDTHDGSAQYWQPGGNV